MSDVVFGPQNTSYLAAGERAGLQRLVSAFYQHVGTLPEAKRIFDMHTDPLPLAEEKLVVFLSAWLGGPRNYETLFGKIRIPHAHSHLDVGMAERDAWLLCMRHAVAEQEEWSDDFKAYFMKAIAVPAERVRVVSQRTRAAEREEDTTH